MKSINTTLIFAIIFLLFWAERLNDSYSKRKWLEINRQILLDGEGIKDRLRGRKAHETLIWFNRNPDPIPVEGINVRVTNIINPFLDKKTRQAIILKDLEELGVLEGKD